jgi:hypothetical protein
VGPVVLRPHPSDGETAIVAFSGVRFKPDRFNLEAHLAGMHGFPKLFVRDPSARWYNAGLPGVGRTLTEIAGRLEREVERLGATRVIAMGPSMGGYAAILFGCMMGAERVVAIAPQTLLDPRLRHAPAADVELEAPDLRSFVSAAPATRIDIVAGWDDHVDVFHSQRIAELPSVRVLALSYQLHELGRRIPRARRQALPREVLEAEVPRDCTVDPRLDADSKARIADTAYAVNRGDWRRVAERIGPVTRRYREWAGPKFDLARALERLGDREGAAKEYAQVLELVPEWMCGRRALADMGKLATADDERQRSAR